MIHASCADVLRDQYLTGRGEAHGHEGQQMQDIAADGDGRHARAADVLADDDHIHDVVDGLQRVGDEQREGEPEQKTGDVSARQVGNHGGFFLRHGAPLFPK